MHVITHQTSTDIPCPSSVQTQVGDCGEGEVLVILVCWLWRDWSSSRSLLTA
jgi:hypothetical protein